MIKRNILFAIFATTAIAIMIPADADAMLKRNGPKPANVTTPKKPANFKAIKRGLSKVKGTKKNLYRNLKATFRSESINRQRKNQFADRYLAANTAYQRDRTQANFNTAQARYQEYLGARQNHVSALNQLNAVKRDVNLWQGNVTLQLNQVRQTSSLQPPKRPQQGAPRGRQNARVQNRRTGAAVAPNPRSALRGGGQVAKRDLRPAVQNPQPVGNPANFPRAAAAPQRARQLNAQAQQWQRKRLEQFQAQQLAAALPSVPFGQQNNGYVPAPAPMGQAGYRASSIGAPAPQQRPVVQNQYDVVTQPMLGSNGRINAAQGGQVAPTQPGQVQQLPRNPNQ